MSVIKHGDRMDAPMGFAITVHEHAKSARSFQVSSADLKFPIAPQQLLGKLQINDAIHHTRQALFGQKSPSI